MPDNLAERMQAILPVQEWDLLQRVAAAAGKLAMPLYVVGGLPRDILLGNPSKDLDLVVEGRAQALAEALAEQYGGRVVVHRAFGTAKWELLVRGPRPQGDVPAPGAVQALDLITARSETYRQPAALPVVAPGTIVDDLRRRDFTINAIAIRLDGPHFGELRDDLGGRRDLEQRLVRALHPRSFVDDPTRMYRAVRYEQRYGFAIAEDTLRLLPEGRGVVQSLSPQRIRHELDLMVDEAKAASMLQRAAELGLLAAIHPSLGYDRAAAERLGAAEKAPAVSVPAVPRRGLRWLLWLMGLPPDEIGSLNKRLHFTAALRNDLLGAARLAAEVDTWAGLSPSGWDERLKDIPPTAVYAVYLVLPRGASRSALEQYLIKWRHFRPLTTGDELKRRGVKPGAEYGRILAELRRAWLDGDVRSAEDEQALLQRLLQQ